MMIGRSLLSSRAHAIGPRARPAGKNRCPREVEASAQLDRTGYMPAGIKDAPTLRDQFSPFDQDHETAPAPVAF
jgi:hypothetical protein